MENPHDQAQNALLVRITGNVEKLNEGIEYINRTLERIGKDNVEIETTTQAWENYMKSVKIHLENNGQMQPPLNPDSLEQS